METKIVKQVTKSIVNIVMLPCDPYLVINVACTGYKRALRFQHKLSHSDRPFPCFWMLKCTDQIRKAIPFFKFLSFET